MTYDPKADVAAQVRLMRVLIEHLQLLQHQNRVQSERVRAATERYATAERERDQFLAVLGHELRAPLAPLRSAYELLLDGDLSDEQRRRATLVMGRQLDHLIDLVNELLDVARISSGKISLKKAAVAVDEIVTKAIESTRTLIEASRQELVVALPSPPPSVEGDPVRLTQVVTNLLSNAAKYGRAGEKIEIKVESDGPFVAIAVKDSGIGISAEALPRVFERFYQAEGALRRSLGGLGLGLAVANELVREHGGTIEARSDGLDRGSEFTVRLPALSA